MEPEAASHSMQDYPTDRICSVCGAQAGELCATRFRGAYHQARLWGPLADPAPKPMTAIDKLAGDIATVLCGERSMQHQNLRELLVLFAEEIKTATTEGAFR